jgi:phage tail sheath protein FI
MVCTGKDADATLFPLNTLVLLTDVLAASGKAGKKSVTPGKIDIVPPHPTRGNQGALWI